MREETLLTPEAVASRTTYLDWDTQPSLFKHYPHFCHRLKLSDYPSLQWLQQTRFISNSSTVAQKPYHRLNIPSAGNLHPIEIYVQLRNIEGVFSGIYHLDVLNQELVMIAEIASEGLEPYMGLEHRFNGALVMISLVPFRSLWKYALRAWRYLYLDLGHQIGALNTAVHHFGYKLTKMSTYGDLNTIMGFGADEVVGAVYGVGEISDRKVKTLSKPLMRVSPTDYYSQDSSLYGVIRTEPIYIHIPEAHRYEPFLQINQRRRSARAFEPSVMSDEAIKTVLNVNAPSTLEIIGVVLQAQSMHRGVYRNDECVMRGNFLTESVHLLLDQRFIARANMVVLIYAGEFSASTHIDAGMYAQDLYMTCETQDVGCSGIGAFYDNEAALWSKHPLVYAVAIGGMI